MVEKTCKECSVKRYANTSYCYKHYIEREKKKKAEKELAKKLKKESSKKFQDNLRKRVHSKTWGLMSRYVRIKEASLDGFVECYTCGKIRHYKEMDAGHFKHDRLDFDERNLKVQCTTCNRYHQGRLDEYTKRLIDDFGIEWFHQLVKDAWSHQGYSIEEMLEIQKELKIKLEKYEDRN